MLDNGKDFSDRAYHIIRFVKFLFFLNLLDILFRYCEAFILYSEKNDVTYVSPILVYERYLWVPTIAFLDGSMLLYLILSQGQKTEAPSDIARGALFRSQVEVKKKKKVTLEFEQVNKLDTKSVVETMMNFKSYEKQRTTLTAIGNENP
jgi:hypothetical protein